MRWFEAQTIHDFLAFEQAVYRSAARRLDAGRVWGEELGKTLRALIQARLLVPAQAAADDPNAPASAAAQAVVQVVVKGEDGEERESFKVHG